MNKSKKRNKNSSTLLHGKVGKQFFVESAAIIRLLLLFGRKKKNSFTSLSLRRLCPGSPFSAAYPLRVCVCEKKISLCERLIEPSRSLSLHSKRARVLFCFVTVIQQQLSLSLRPETRSCYRHPSFLQSSSSSSWRESTLYRIV